MKENNFFNWISKHIDVIVVLTIALIIIAPSFISQPHSAWFEGCPLLWNIDFSGSGQIGDTIGGITAPFIGVLSIILLYLTLKSQQKQTKEQYDRDNISLLCKQLITSIDNFIYKGESYTLDNKKRERDVVPFEYKGGEAISKLLDNLYCDDLHINAHEDLESMTCGCELLNILVLCKATKIALDNSEIKDKSAYNQILINQFQYRIYPKIKEHGTNNLKKHMCDECGYEHGFTDELVEIIKYLEKKLIINSL
ncbi:hypothetical protein FACS1894162_5370 [Bacteroidia bacterium]|nr:hypothetical protein FACS1894162_5370 [Bacteroidia bacterium]